MKKIYFLFIALAAGILANAQLLTFEFASLGGGEASAGSNSSTTGGVAASTITRGPGVTAGANSGRFNSSGWTTATTPDPDDYVEFTITPNAGYTLEITDIVVMHQRSGTGPVRFVFRTSLDSYAADATNEITIPDATGTQTSTFTFTSAISTTSAVTVRLYAYAAEAAAGTWGPGDGTGNDIVVNGTAVNASGNAITTGTLTGAPFCLDGSITGAGSVDFTTTGSYSSATLTAQLSDASGSFASPVDIGSTSVSGTDPSGTITLTIPAATASGTGYKVRIISTSPAVTGTETTAFRVVNGVLNISNLNGVFGETTANVSWTNPPACYDEVLIVVKSGSSVSATPAGDGTAYTADPSFTGAGSAFDGGKVVYKGNSSPLTVTDLTVGTTYYVKVFTRRGTLWSSGEEVSGQTDLLPLAGEIVINQFSPGYGGANDEYVEIVNKTNKTFDLSALAIRYRSASGGSGPAGGALSGTLLPNRYFLLSTNATVTVGQTNLTRDGAITSGFAAGGGQIALVRIADNVIVDAVGYGVITDLSYTETAAAPAPPATGGISRVVNGQDTDDNSVDFTTVDNADILLHNSLTVLPVNFGAVKAVQQGTGIRIDWSNLTERDVVNYIIERSADGRSFTAIGDVNARLNTGEKADYSFLDPAPFRSVNYYRIKSAENNGRNKFSIVVKVDISEGQTTVVVLYPNPINKGQQLSLQATSLAKGTYTIRVVNMQGQQLVNQVFVHQGGAITEPVQLPAGAQAGMYQLVIAGAEQQFVRSFVLQ